MKNKLNAASINFMWGFATAILIIITLLVGSFILHPNETAQTDDEPIFDTAYIEQWCHGDEGGTVRMIGAWFYDYEPSNQTYVLEDESGELWAVREVGENIGEDDFLLLWINDNNTPNYSEDDFIIKTWNEVHE